MMVMPHAFDFMILFNFVVLASCGGGLYVFKNHTLLARAWNKILVVYASQGLDVTLLFCYGSLLCSFRLS